MSDKKRKKKKRVGGMGGGGGGGGGTLFRHNGLENIKIYVHCPWDLNVKSLQILSSVKIIIIHAVIFLSVF